MKRKMILVPMIIILLLVSVAPVMATQPKVWMKRAMKNLKHLLFW